MVKKAGPKDVPMPEKLRVPNDNKTATPGTKYIRLEDIHVDYSGFVEGAAERAKKKACGDGYKYIGEEWQCGSGYVVKCEPDTRTTNSAKRFNKCSDPYKAAIVEKGLAKTRNEKIAKAREDFNKAKRAFNSPAKTADNKTSETEPKLSDLIKKPKTKKEKRSEAVDALREARGKMYKEIAAARREYKNELEKVCKPWTVSKKAIPWE